MQKSSTEMGQTCVVFLSLAWLGDHCVGCSVNTSWLRTPTRGLRCGRPPSVRSCPSAPCNFVPVRSPQQPRFFTTLASWYWVCLGLGFHICRWFLCSSGGLKRTALLASFSPKSKDSTCLSPNQPRCGGYSSSGAEYPPVPTHRVRRSVRVPCPVHHGPLHFISSAWEGVGDRVSGTYRCWTCHL